MKCSRLILSCCPRSQGWQYVTVRSEFAYYLLRTLNSTAPAYRTSVQFLKRIVPMYRICNITKKTHRTSVLYFLEKIEEYHAVPAYRTAILARNLTNKQAMKKEKKKQPEFWLW